MRFYLRETLILFNLSNYFMKSSYRYWVTEMHVDGFRFDLASILTRGSRLSYSTLLIIILADITKHKCSFAILCLLIFSLWDAVNVYGSQSEDDLLRTGSPLSSPPLIDMISNDPILRGVKVIFVVASSIINLMLR